MTPEKTRLDPALKMLQTGELHDPFSVLGRHPDGDGEVVRAFLPSAEHVELEGFGPMQRITGSDIFVAHLSGEEMRRVPRHYHLAWIEKHDGSSQRAVSPYTFLPLTGDLDLHLFGEGRHHHAYRFLGAHPREVDGIEGCLFAVWAPAVRRISVVGDFNGWNGLRHPMRNLGVSGVWELFIPGLTPGDLYKYEILSEQRDLLLKTDPYAQMMTLRPDTASRIVAPSQHRWLDEDWMRQRAEWDWQHSPLNAYEVHLGSWRRGEDGRFLGYGEIADRLIPYVLDLGYTHIELLPVSEHPLDESWGYQVSGYYAPTARFGDPDGLRELVDRCHQAGLGVILDWVPAHFPRDDFALARFTGQPIYEHADPRRGEHREWGTLVFDYGRNEVKNFLLSNAVYWLEEFHIDGLRVDAVASMLYLDYSRDPGEWIPNEFGGRENLEAIAFLKEMNEVLHERFPGMVTIAEESTAWPMISRPVWMGGLGFSMKWNMGWMNDTLEYMQHDPVYRRFHHERLTFSQLYAYTENFVLPLSHDEVVHMKRSLLEKMPGDDWQKFANLRLLYAWQTAHPGKKLLFMGAELAQRGEWDASRELEWSLLDSPSHQGVHTLVRDLNRLYRDDDSLHHHDFESDGFRWIDCHDSEQSVLSFLRQHDGGHTVCIFNFTPVPRQRYRIGLPTHGHYREILNTDAECYGGTNQGNHGVAPAEDIPWMGFEHSIELTLPPLGALFLKPEVADS